MSRSWNWDKRDDQKVLAWAAKASEEALLEGNDYLAAEILKGASNFFSIRTLAMLAGSNAALVDKWIYGIHSEIYSGTSNISNLEIESISTRHSVIDCFRLLNAFYDLNDLHVPKAITAGTVMADLIIPEPFQDDGISW
ncbi:hypothetical protein [Ferrovum sp. PN-J185]|uniref:hypothetical protein n=1 Tax=Ferrovum sp. PN-J185 TaxID=1356306 RepID=UPI0007932EB8|nr:hypothetical protein [Ferrovum sp. PN-J185]KXW55384.1 hypothetical protein FV185_16310 [Ferrovum sp. PN-J185]